MSNCRRFCGRQFCCEDRPFLTFLTRKAGRENISTTIAFMAEKENPAFAARQRSVARSLRAAAALSALSARSRREGERRREGLVRNAAGRNEGSRGRKCERLCNG